MNLIESATKIEVTIHPGEIMPGSSVTNVNTYDYMPADISIKIQPYGWESEDLRKLAYNLLDLADALEVIDSNNENLIGSSTEEVFDSPAQVSEEQESPSYTPASAAIPFQFRGY